MEPTPVYAGCEVAPGKHQKVRTEKVIVSKALSNIHCWECRAGHHDHCDQLKMAFCKCRQEDHEESF